jgi:chromosome segregation ATPase
MSTAGKVLAVLFLLVSLVWIVLAAGVSRLNTNANTKLHELTVEVEKLGATLQETQHDIATLLDQTSQNQEQMDREFTALRAEQAEVEKSRSQIQENLSRIQNQFATVEETIKSAQAALEFRNTDLQDETKALADAKSEVQTRMDDSTKLMARLTALRKDFQRTYDANLEMLGKLGRSNEGQRVRAN